MYHREYAITPTQAATNGAMDIFVEGCRKDDARGALFGLSVLRSATAEQLQAAISAVEISRQVPRAEIEAMFLR
jgi:hypothetical protein